MHCVSMHATVMRRFTFHPGTVLLLFVINAVPTESVMTLKGNLNSKILIYSKCQTNALKYLLPLNLLERLTPGTVKCAAIEQD